MCSRVVFLLDTLEHNLFPCFFHPPETAYIPWVNGPLPLFSMPALLHLSDHAFRVTSLTLFFSASLFHILPFDYIGSTWMIKDNPPILMTAD